MAPLSTAHRRRAPVFITDGAIGLFCRDAREQIGAINAHALLTPYGWGNAPIV